MPFHHSGGFVSMFPDVPAAVARRQSVAVGAEQSEIFQAVIRPQTISVI
ncbi:MAG: hypothetical protein HYX52_01490 [Chloroflexi bacterium]|nr:hypothetical protein [Chloroflexota bacterium]